MIGRAATLALIKPCTAAHPQRAVHVLRVLRALQVPPETSPQAVFQAAATEALLSSSSSPSFSPRLPKPASRTASLPTPNLSIAAAAWLPLLPEGRAAAFYKEHAGRFFYGRLTSFMQSGPVLALCLAAPPGCDAVTAWRTLLGPTKVARARLTHPQTLRGGLGLSDTRNLGHGSDAAATAAAELALFFPSLTVAEDSQGEGQSQGQGLRQVSSAGVQVAVEGVESGVPQLKMEGCSLARRVMKCGTSALPLGAALVSQADGGTLGLDSRADDQAVFVAASLLRAAGWDVLNVAGDRRP